MPFLIIFAALIVMMVFLVYWFTGSILKKQDVNIKSRSIRGIRFIISVLLFVICSIWRTGLIILLHLLLVYALTELAVKIAKKVFRHFSKRRVHGIIKTIYRFSIIPLLISVIILGCGFYNMNRVVRTDYHIMSEKVSNNYKVVLITDTHYATVQSPELLKQKAKEISTIHPDVVLLGGDIVEEGTSKAAMEEVFEVLGGIKSRYGVYYVYGNHDRQLYSDSPSYTVDELNKAIEDKGIKILKDETVKINDEFVLAGREDASYRFEKSKRATAKELLKNTEEDDFVLVLDHQPNGFDEAVENGADLQLSGHTHAGQIFPLGTFGELFGVMKRYGEYTRGDSRLIVSSGFTGWGFSMRTEENCEYVVVEIKKE